MERRAAVLLVLLMAGVTAAQGAARSPASLVPAQLMLYHELNLAQWHGSGEGAVSLDRVFEQSGLMPGQRAIAGNIPIPGPIDSVRDSLSLAWEALQFVGPRVGWTMLPGVGNAPAYVGVAELKDETAFSEAVERILRDMQLEYHEETRPGGVRVLSISGGPAVAIGPDWAALSSSPELVEVVAQLAATGGEGSLAADQRYQQAVKGLPADALVTQYASPMLFVFLNELITSASRPAPGLPLPPWPEDGIAWAIRVSAETQEGRRFLSVTWTVGAEAASSVTAAAMFALMSPVFDRAARAARKTICLSHVKHLSMAMSLYLADRGRFPEADRWTTELGEYVPDRSVFQCPDDHSGAECSYGMNAGLSGRPESTVGDASRQVIIYETAHPGPCPSGGQTDVASPPRHLGGNNFGFADGHAKWFTEQATQPRAVDW